MTSKPSSLRLTKLIGFITMVMVGFIHGDEETEVCKREFHPRKTGDNGYKLSIVGNPLQYKANEVYTVSISGTFPNQTFSGFVLNAVPRHARDDTITLGTLQNIDPKKSKSARLCPHVITHIHSRESLEEVEILWTAPQTGSGCVEFRASVGDEERRWYKDDGALTKILCEEATTDRTQNDQPHGQKGECCACGSAKYEMTFEGIWSQESHPRDYPTHKRLLHWSNIVGASHSDRFRIWDYGGYATKGVKEVCEFGYPRSVEEEVKRSSREVRTIIKTTGIWWKDPVGIVQNRSARFTTDRRRHYVSMISMLGPSPDWCVGVSAEDLCLPNCTWSRGFTFDLLPWDAGTDNGVTYMAPNSKTDPQQRIKPISNNWPDDPRSPFFGPEPIKPLARIKVELLNPKEEVRVAGACPDDGKVEVDFFGEGESSALDAEKKKEQGSGGMCEVKPWDDWSGCSVTCGVGSRMRRRSYKNPEANEAKCGLPIVERENCIGIENECETTNEECALTLWSDWSPCSVTCGKGVSERRRYYLIDGDETRCNRTVNQVRECSAPQTDCTPVRKSHEICTMPSLRGPCRGNFQRWYYDRKTKKCLPFQYGGCRGNGNRFETMDECMASCAEDDDSVTNSNEYCLEPSERGTCGKKLEMWYFDRDMRKCLPFEYSGCSGNKNRFKTMDDCTDACQSVAIDATDDTGNGAGRCSLPSVPGNCRENLERWYFDTQMQKCLPFDYTGCGGNENNFRTMDECTESCQLSRGDTGGSSPRDRCALPSEKGPCRNDQERWYFDNQMQKCLPFDYSGCGGNTNNFQTMDECTELCQLSIDGENQNGGDDVIYPSARCGLLSDKGPCRANMERWYFDMQMQKCLPFEYGGCAGNSNNFFTMDECSQSCQPVVIERQSTGSRCRQESERGPCRDTEERWYFDTQMEKCLPFEYGGCTGNENNFRTMDECTESCQVVSGGQGDNNKEGRCRLPSERGPCRDTLERWYFDNQMEKCLPFEYGGCNGNSNNFETMDECTESCQLTNANTGGRPPGNRCTLSSEKGPCTDDQERWFFDTQMEKCLPFDYGGCAGNDNNFHTMDECSEACHLFSGATETNPSPDIDVTGAGRFKRFCTFPRDRGLCRGRLERWYFDTDQLRCLPFHYGGCGGNANNFQTADECMEMCKDNHEELNPNQITTGRQSSSPSSSSSSRSSSTISNTSGNDNLSIQQTHVVKNNNIHANNFLNELSRCNLAADPGPCEATVERWYFDSQTETCKPFNYGGCLGNRNNFQDMYTCLGACHLLGQRSRPSTASEINHGNICHLPSDTGPCRSNLERWYFNKRTNSCISFQYGGCGGNENNFHDYKTCAELCQDSEVNGSNSDSNFALKVKVESKCSQPIDFGPCQDNVEKWYFDPQMEKCLPFQYGGCGGNDNRFNDLYSCLDECRPSVSPTESSTAASNNNNNGQNNDGNNRCFLSPDRGPCLARIERFYYNPQLNSCLTFQYGGCGGNGNSFQSQKACSETCRGSSKPETSVVHFVRNQTTRTNSRVVDCRMSGWSNWGICSTTCGNGHRSKQRHILVQPTSNGKQCSKTIERKQKCKLPLCENECQYGHWSQWNECTKTCGYGSYRQRTQKSIPSSSSPKRPSSSSSSSSSGDKLKCIDRVQRALCDVPKCPL